MDEKTRQLIAQTEMLLERFRQKAAYCQELLMRTRLVGQEIEQRVLHAKHENTRYNPDRDRLT